MDLQRIQQNLREVAAGLEAGQANPVLTGLLRKLQQEQEAEVFSAAILLLGDADRTFASQLAGVDARLRPGDELQVGCPAGGALVDRRSSMVLSLDEWVQAADKPKIVRLQQLNGVLPCRFGVVDAEQVGGFDTCNTNGLFQDANCLIVIGPDNFVPSDLELVALKELAQFATALLPVLMPPDTAVPAGGVPWTAAALPKVLKIIKPVAFDEFVGPGGPLRNTSHPARVELTRRHAAARLLFMHKLFQQELDRELRRQEARIHADEFSQTLIEGDDSAELFVSSGRTLIARAKQDLNSAIADIQRRSKAALVGKNDYYRVLTSSLARFSEGDLRREQKHDVFELSLSADRFAELQQEVWTAICDTTNDEQQALSDLRAQFVTKFKAHLGADAARFEAPRELRVSDPEFQKLRDHLDFDPRYRGELRQRGIFKRLGEGRRSVFMLLMTFSIFGSMVGFNYRDYAFVGFFFLMIFLGSFIYTYFSWRKEDEFHLAKEATKLKDQLRTDFMRVVGDVERERIRLHQEALHKLLLAAETAAAQSEKSMAQVQRRELEQSRDLRRVRSQKIEARIKDIIVLIKQVSSGQAEVWQTAQ